MLEFGDSDTYNLYFGAEYAFVSEVLAHFESYLFDQILALYIGEKKAGGEQE